MSSIYKEILNQKQTTEVGNNKLLHELGFGKFGIHHSSSINDVPHQISQKSYSQHKNRVRDNYEVINKLHHKNIDHSDVKESIEIFKASNNSPNTSRNSKPTIDWNRRCLKQVIIEYSTANFEYRLLIIRQIVEAINYLHYNKYYHGDIRPENIFLYENNVEKIVNEIYAKQK
ncbi:hypothetical protein B4U80_14881 [Leptotrombidium deliense]|uniref:Protein kinase domain-containing protein n=1 Tax=Leptotrombidium deliense TaxID=299467 RepID=A0A443S8A6_9ACAR|nr:hypothetical protein B4U80_14881 [Leptotrombidium deliense]